MRFNESSFGHRAAGRRGKLCSHGFAASLPVRPFAMGFRSGPSTTGSRAGWATGAGKIESPWAGCTGTVGRRRAREPVLRCCPSPPLIARCEPHQSENSTRGRPGDDAHRGHDEGCDKTGLLFPPCHRCGGVVDSWPLCRYIILRPRGHNISKYPRQSQRSLMIDPGRQPLIASPWIVRFRFRQWSQPRNRHIERTLISRRNRGGTKSCCRGRWLA